MRTGRLCARRLSAFGGALIEYGSGERIGDVLRGTKCVAKGVRLDVVAFGFQTEDANGGQVCLGGDGRSLSNFCTEWDIVVVLSFDDNPRSFVTEMPQDISLGQAYSLLRQLPTWATDKRN
jgi:hypothetical protein